MDHRHFDDCSADRFQSLPVKRDRFRIISNHFESTDSQTTFTADPV